MGLEQILIPGIRAGWPKGWTVQHSCSGALLEIRQPHAVIYSKEEELSPASSLADEAGKIPQDKPLSI